jgi:hypothetical protein
MTPLYFNEEEDMAYIKNTNLELATKERRSKLMEEYKEALESLSKSQDGISWYLCTGTFVSFALTSKTGMSFFGLIQFIHLEHFLILLSILLQKAIPRFFFLLSMH